MKSILGTKGEMGARYNNRGQRVPVTYILATPNVVLDLKENKITLGAGLKKKVKKTENAYLARAGFAPRYVREVKAEPDSRNERASRGGGEVKVGDKVSVAIFAPGDEVKVTGITKGKGFTGVVKRWGFAGGPKTHGQSDRHRAPGSIGQTTTPGRVFRGKKMAGHHGTFKQTVTGLEVVEVNAQKNILIVKGAIPGAKNGFLIVERTGKAKKYTPVPEEKKDEEETEGAKGSDETEGTNESTAGGPLRSEASESRSNERKESNEKKEDKSDMAEAKEEGK